MIIEWTPTGECWFCTALLLNIRPGTALATQHLEAATAAGKVFACSEHYEGAKKYQKEGPLPP